MSVLSRILLVDDDPGSLRLLVELLRGQGFSLRVASGSQDGHQQAVAYRPDLILLDVCMPHMDGHQLCRLLKSDPRTAGIPVIFLTGRGDVSDKLKGFDLGCCDYITKPFSGEEVIARINVHRRAGHAEGRGTDASAQAGEDSVTPALVLRAQAVLRETMAHPLSLVELAHQIGTNERTLTLLFRQHFGLPVFAWLRRERFRKACALLLETDLGITEIALSVGYATPSAFTTAFREQFGITPSHYRRSGGLLDTHG